MRVDEVLTVGLEEEFFIVDAVTREVAPRASELVAADGLDPPAQHEIADFQIETTTPVCRTMVELANQLRRNRCELAAAAAVRGLKLVASGTAILGATLPIPLHNTPRFQQMTRRFGAIVDSQSISGLHIHVGVPGADRAVQVCNHLRPWLPALLALSANSPYWQGQETRYASWRWTQYSRWPTSGPPPHFDSLAHYHSTVRSLLDSGAAMDPGTVYWDVRPSWHLPTVEVRVCDTAATVEDAVLLAALTRALASVALADVDAGYSPVLVPHAVLRAALWRAARDGMEGRGFDPETGQLVPFADLVDKLLRRIQPALELACELDVVTELLSHHRARGSGAARQRRAFAGRGCLTDVVDMLVDQTSQAEPTIDRYLFDIRS